MKCRFYLFFYEDYYPCGGMNDLVYQCNSFKVAVDYINNNIDPFDIRQGGANLELHDNITNKTHSILKYIRKRLPRTKESSPTWALPENKNEIPVEELKRAKQRISSKLQDLED